MHAVVLEQQAADGLAGSRARGDQIRGAHAPATREFVLLEPGLQGFTRRELVGAALDVQGVDEGPYDLELAGSLIAHNPL